MGVRELIGRYPRQEQRRERGRERDRDQQRHRSDERRDDRLGDVLRVDGVGEADADRVQLSLLLAMFATFWLAWFLGLLRWLFDGAERSARGFVRASPIAFGGGLAGLAVAAATGVAQLTAIELVGSVPDSVIRALDLLSAYGIVWAEVLLSVHLLSAFFVIRVTRVLPDWIGGLAAIGTVLGFFQAVLVLSPGQGNGVFGIAGVVWFALFVVYILATSIHIARRAETALLAG
jgi:hypothetical protein